MNLYSDLAEAYALRRRSASHAAGVEVDSVGQLGRIVQRHRHQTGISQEALAGRAKVGRRFLADLERGKETIRAKELLRVCHALGLKVTIAEDPIDPKKSKNIFAS